MSKRISLSKKKRDFIFFYYKNKCADCCKSFNFMDVHHVDGNPANNDIDNLMLLCRKCHARRHSDLNDFMFENDFFRAEINRKNYFYELKECDFDVGGCSFVSKDYVLDLRNMLLKFYDVYDWRFSFHFTKIILSQLNIDPFGRGDK